LKIGLSVIAVNGVLLDVDDRPVDIRLLATVARLSRPTNTHRPLTLPATKSTSNFSNGRSTTHRNKSKTQSSGLKTTGYFTAYFSASYQLSNFLQELIMVTMSLFIVLTKRGYLNKL